MSQQIPEADWKVFRELHPVALERFCERALADIARHAADLKKTPHERYLDVFKLIKKRDKTLGELFNDFRRSTALLMLLGIQKWLTEEELARFSPETLARIRWAAANLEDD